MCVQGLIPGVRQLAQGVVLVDFANQPFQFSGPFLGGGQPLSLLEYVSGLLGGLCFLDGADKLGPVILGILRDGPKYIGNQGQDSFGLDMVLCGAEGADRIFPVLAASVLRDTLAVVGAVNIHFTAAVGAVHQAGQGVSLPEAVRVAFGVSPDMPSSVKWVGFGSPFRRA